MTGTDRDLHVRRSSAIQLQFDWLPDKPMLRVADIVAATGMQTTFVEEWFAEKCHRYGDGDGRVRPAMRIPRAFVIALLVRSAKYDAATKLQAIGSCFRECSAQELLHLRAELDAHLRRKTAACA